MKWPQSLEGGGTGLRRGAQGYVRLGFFGFLEARDVFACHEARRMGEAAGVAAAVERTVNAGHGFAGSIETVHRLHVPAEHLEFLRDADAAAGEVVPREHADHVVGACADLPLLIRTAELIVDLGFNGFIPDLDLLFQAFKTDAAFLGEFFERVALPEIFLLLEFSENTFLGPGGKTHERRELDLLKRTLPGRLIGEHVVAAVGIAGKLRRDVTDAFAFCNEARTVLVDQDAALTGDEPPAAVGAAAAVDDNAAGV